MDSFYKEVDTGLGPQRGGAIKIFICGESLQPIKSGRSEYANELLTAVLESLESCSSSREEERNR